MNVAYAEQSVDMPLPADVARVRPRRQRIGMKIAELAEEAGVSRDTLSDLETGKKRPHPETVEKVLAALDRIEHEVGLDEDTPPLPDGVRPIGDPADDLYEVAIEDGTRRVVVKGRPKDAAERQEIAETAMRLLREAEADARRAGRGRAVP